MVWKWVVIASLSVSLCACEGPSGGGGSTTPPAAEPPALAPAPPQAPTPAPDETPSSEPAPTQAPDEEPEPTEEPDEDPEPFLLDQILSATWQVVAIDENGNLGVATAFAIDNRQLATNAHVAIAFAQSIGISGGGVFVVQHETGELFEVIDAWAHPGYDASFGGSPDVGIIEVDDALPSFLSIANSSILQNLEVFDEIRLCGFPGDVTLALDDPSAILSGDFRPRATCLGGAISSLRPFDSSEPATNANTKFIQHDIATTAGTSGSPVFDSAGEVVAVHSSATSDEEGLNRFAIRADVITELYRWIGEGTVESVLLLEPEPPNVTIAELEGIDATCLFLSLDDIDGTIASYESAMAAGTTKEEALADAVQMCYFRCLGFPTLTCEINCNGCFVKIINAVWPK